MKRYLMAAALLTGCAAQPPPPPPPIVKAEPPPKQEIYVPPDPFDGMAPNVRAAIESNQTPTLRNGITTLFAFDPDIEWTIYCWPLRATDIRLNSDEYLIDKDSVILGDSMRWLTRLSPQAVVVEPLGTTADPDMTSNLVIHTTKRSYHLMLRLRHRYMAAVAFYYPHDVKAAEAARQVALKQVAAAQNTQAADPPTQEAGK
jgi:type IV secretory pathway VirB9-like protein